ncbi:uncharacterized protein LOC142471885 [Ascaphus truei]|uniref:uncharacterized protein LOC142471885 n=1 Tax=Ascaphus truei TaxID=8439 RepID=UPI003F592206
MGGSWRRGSLLGSPYTRRMPGQAGRVLHHGGQLETGQSAGVSLYKENAWAGWESTAPWGAAGDGAVCWGLPIQGECLGRLGEYCTMGGSWRRGSLLGSPYTRRIPGQAGRVLHHGGQLETGQSAGVSLYKENAWAGWESTAPWGAAGDGAVCWGLPIQGEFLGRLGEYCTMGGSWRRGSLLGSPYTRRIPGQAGRVLHHGGQLETGQSAGVSLYKENAWAGWESTAPWGAAGDGAVCWGLPIQGECLGRLGEYCTMGGSWRRGSLLGSPYTRRIPGLQGEHLILQSNVHRECKQIFNPFSAKEGSIVRQSPLARTGLRRGGDWLFSAAQARSLPSCEGSGFSQCLT